MLGRHVQTEDPRTNLQKMRIRELRDIARKRGMDIRDGGRFDLNDPNLTKDRLLAIMGVEDYVPPTKPLSTTTTGNVPLEYHEDYGLEIRAWKLGIPHDPSRSRDDLIAAIRQAETALFTPNTTATVQQMPERVTEPEDEGPAPHSVEAMQSLSWGELTAEPRWALLKLAKAEGVAGLQLTWKKPDVLKAIKAHREELNRALPNNIFEETDGPDLPSGG